MRKRLMFLITGVAILIGLVGCGFAAKSIIIPESKYTANYDKMFEAAISAGAGLGYHPEYQDKKTGVIKLLHQVGSTAYRITVQFGRLEGQTGVKVTGIAGTDLINPFIASEVQKIENAIMQAAGI